MRDILLVGGTGTLGNALLDQLDPRKCIVFSRDELKQHELRHKYPGLKTILGDIRSPESLNKAMEQVKTVYHVAALKHVDVLEENPEEAYATNIVGTMNSAQAAIRNGVINFYFTSTDKAVLPINVYGMTKAISERYLLNLNQDKPFSTKFNVFRWGNIVGSRGSAVNLFAKTLKQEAKVYVTDKRMTRFWMRIEDAVKYMLTFKGDNTKVNYPEMKASSIIDMATAIAELLDIKHFDIEVVGIRPGEKIHECLYSDHENCIRSDTAPRLSLEELKDLVKPVLSKLC